MSNHKTILKALQDFLQSESSQEISRFIVVGICSTIAYTMISIVCFKWGCNPFQAGSIAFVGATLLSYYGNARSTFKARMNIKTLFRFFTVTMLGFVLSLLLIKWNTMMDHSHWTGIGMVVIIIPPLNFIGHRFWTFHARHIHPTQDNRSLT